MIRSMDDDEDNLLLELIRAIKLAHDGVSSWMDDYQDKLVRSRQQYDQANHPAEGDDTDALQL